MRVDGARGRAAARRSRPAAGQRLPARPPRARQGAARPAALPPRRVVTALWPSRSATRRAYGQVLAQRNALLARVRSGRSPRARRATWDLELARTGLALREDRARAVDLLAGRFAAVGEELGLAGDAELRYRPRTRAADADAFAAELAERLDADLERGFTGHGPHRDDLALLRDGRELRVYGSQGEQRLALLALLLAERDALTAERGAPPLLLLDDVMSELDADRRRLLVRRITAAGQSVVTTTDLGHVPGADDAGVAQLHVEAGEVREGGARRMRHRRAPRGIAIALGASRRPRGAATPLGRVQRAWPGAVGSSSRPRDAHRGGRRGLVVTCDAAVWAQELDLLQGEVVARLAPPCRASGVDVLRCRAAASGAWAREAPR